MLDNLLLHPKTKTAAHNFVVSKAGSLLIIGEPGSGKAALAEAVAASLLKLPPDGLSSYPYFHHLKIADSAQSISINQIRNVISFLKLKATGMEAVKRVVLIENAHLMTEEAQNALLKILEEPNSDTLFILTAASEESLLPTISSRTKVITAYPVSLKAAREYFEPASAPEIERQWQLSRGQAGLLSALLQSQEHALSSSIEEAKKFIKLNDYGRLLMLRNLKGRADLLNLLRALNKLLAALYQNAVKQKQNSLAKKLLSDRKTVNSLTDSLSRNAAPRLAQIYLSLNLKV